jgi:hypothetical protein
LPQPLLFPPHGLPHWALAVDAIPTVAAIAAANKIFFISQSPGLMAVHHLHIVVKAISSRSDPLSFLTMSSKGYKTAS